MDLRKKKSITLLGEIISFLVLIVMAYFMAGMIIYLDRIIGVVGGDIDYTMTLEATPIPIKHENLMLAFLESTCDSSSCQSIPMKKLITLAMVQESRNIYLDDIAGAIDVGEEAEKVLKKWSIKGDINSVLLRLKTPDNDLKLVWDIENFRKARKILRVQKISTDVYSPFGEGKLELYVS